MNMKKILDTEKFTLKKLRWWDIGIITIIMFGPAIISSTNIFCNTDPQVLEQGTEFSSSDNVIALCIQAIQLFVAGAYLYFRKFDFLQWKFKITAKSTIFAVLLFLLVSACMDVVNIAQTGVAWIPEYVTYNTLILGAFSEVNLSLVLFSLLNGIYEEIFFLGICTMVDKKYSMVAFVYSLVLRFSFHTYQGIILALGIGAILGVIYYIFYKKKSDNLYVYMLSHSFGDIFGLSVLHFL